MSAAVAVPLFVLAAMVGGMVRLAAGSVACSWQALLGVNVAGSALFGVVLAADLDAAITTVLGVGLCGALTTYSSFALEARSLGWRWGTAYAALTIGCVAGAASIGSTLVG